MADQDNHECGYFPMGEGSRSGSPSSIRSDPLSMHAPSPIMASLAALQYLPIPVLVLSSQKTVALANEAMGRLLDIDFESISEVLQNKTMGELGIDILQNGSPVLITWEDFLDSVVEDSKLVNIPDAESEDPTGSGHTTPTAARTPQQAMPPDDQPLPKLSITNLARTMVYDVAVDVVVAPLQKPDRSSAYKHAMQVSCIVSIWSIEETPYYTLSFTSANATETTPKASSRIVNRSNTGPYLNKSRSSGSSTSSGHRSGSNSNTASKAVTPILQQPEFPPRGPPQRRGDITASASVFQKVTQLKDAILNSINLPSFALSHDESLGLPNKALLRLLPKDRMYSAGDQRDFLSQFPVWTDDFQRTLSVDEFPVVEVCRSRKRVKTRIGMRQPVTGTRIVFEVSGEPVYHDESGEFLGGIVVFKDITEYANEIAAQIQENERQFESIANFMPVMVWTTTPDGLHDWFSQRWYDYTGLTVEQSIGEGWRLPFHPEDMKITVKSWFHCLKTGEEYNTEYRCQRFDGEWRWMLGRALPIFDDSGRIVKWIGTCTDIHDLVVARQEARRTREQLQQVIQHAKILLWAVNRDNKLVLLEGDDGDTKDDGKLGGGGNREEMLGQDIYDVFQIPAMERERWQEPIHEILEGKQQTEIVMGRYISEARFYRTRLVPLLNTSRTAGVDGKVFVDGVIGVSMDVTELREREEQLREQEKENSRLLANTAAAKEASRMKSNLLANTSHELRTPIAGVIGMSELLFDMDLNEEQKECTENIHRSASSLLTVINDILDFSKVESGRLDVEEVQFSLSVVLRDVNKMMSFAAQRKGLAYQSFIQDEVEMDLRVMGDPGRLRQILINVLTNSIKFTSVGVVKLTVGISRETKNTVTVNFTVSDTGIGIEEEVRKRLFQPFSQADSSTARRFGGTGLGLAISKNLVELMKGQIWLDSKLGQGTTATFWIPFSKVPCANDGSPLVNLESIPDRLQSDMSVSCGSSEGHTPPMTPQITNGHTQSHPANSYIPDQWMSLTESERQKVHILVVEDNHINQQIALKTITKFHFSVNAVWNGQEALDYLEQEFSPSHPRPDIILMDVQMPIRDGYSATHAIRTEAPWRNRPEIRGVPIVAMTASAIQGDKEKCVSCGMDDYLAKPVRGKLLEKMLVKWAIEGRRKRANIMLSKSIADQHGVAVKPTQTSAASLSANDLPQSLETPIPSPETTAQALTASLDRLNHHSDAAFARTAEDEGDRAMRRINAEERDTKLRDEKLLSLARPQAMHHSSSQGQETEPCMPLTEENIEKLAHEQVGDAPVA